MNTSRNVNKMVTALSPLERALGERLRGLLTSVGWLQDVEFCPNPSKFNRAFDWLVTFKIPQGPAVELYVDCRSEPRPVHFPYVPVEREFDGVNTKTVRVRVFAAPTLSPRMRQLCEKHGWTWFDLAGNCRISIPGALHLEHTGVPPVHHRPKPSANLRSSESGRIIRALLAPEHAAMVWTQRKLHSECFAGVSLGMVNKLVRLMRDEAFISEAKGGGFTLRDPLNLLYAWREAYRFELHERRDYFTLLRGDTLEQGLAKLYSESAGLASYCTFSAADHQAPHVRQAKTWMYISEETCERFEKLTEAKRVETGGNMIVFVPRDRGVFAFAERDANGATRMASTNPVQTYLDLGHAGGRGQEAAEALLEQRLIPVWREHGFIV